LSSVVSTVIVLIETAFDAGAIIITQTGTIATSTPTSSAGRAKASDIRLLQAIALAERSIGGSSHRRHHNLLFVILLPKSPPWRQPPYPQLRPSFGYSS